MSSTISSSYHLRPTSGFLNELNNAGLPIPKRSAPHEWVVHCSGVGTGIAALKYLARYLYRGVISERNIISNTNFRYTENETGEIRYRTLEGEDFLHLILRHVLPRGLRRARDYGFLHGNAKKLLFIVQLVHHVQFMAMELHPRPAFKCQHCEVQMIVVGVCPAWNSG